VTSSDLVGYSHSRSLATMPLESGQIVPVFRNNSGGRLAISHTYYHFNFKQTLLYSIKHDVNSRLFIYTFELDSDPYKMSVCNLTHFSKLLECSDA